MPTSQIYEVSAVLVDAQNKTLPTTPVQIIVGIPGKLLCFVKAVLFIDVRAGAYTNIDELLSVQFAYASGNTVSSPILDIANDLVDTGSVWVAEVGCVLRVEIGSSVISNLHSLADCEGQAINIKASNQAAGNFTGGHVDNRIHVTLFYTINDVPLT